MRRDRHQGLRVESTNCEDVYVSGCTKCRRDEHDKQYVLSTEWAGAIPLHFCIHSVCTFWKQKNCRTGANSDATV